MKITYKNKLPTTTSYGDVGIGKVFSSIPEDGGVLCMKVLIASKEAAIELETGWAIAFHNDQQVMIKQVELIVE